MKKKVTKKISIRSKNNDATKDLAKIKKTKKKRKKRYYFGKETHLAIVKYQDENNINIKNKIYVDEIKPAFEKLVENLIFIHGFSSCKNSFFILKSDCISFLFETLQKFNPNKGSKAFSYFNVCAKHFLIIQQKKKIKKNSRHVSMFDDNLSIDEKKQIENYNVINCQEKQMILAEDKILIKKMLEKIAERTSNSNEKKCISAIRTLFDKIEDLDYLNKRAIFVYLRELSGLNAKQLSVAMSNLRKYYRDISGSTDEFIFFGE